MDASDTRSSKPSHPDFAVLVRAAASQARRRAAAFPTSVSGDDLPWAVIEAFDAEIRGHVERDRRIEGERDRVPSSRQTITWPCGRPQASQRPPARPKRITAESCGQSMG